MVLVALDVAIRGVYFNRTIVDAVVATRLIAVGVVGFAYCSFRTHQDLFRQSRKNDFFVDFTPESTHD